MTNRLARRVTAPLVTLATTLALGAGVVAGAAAPAQAEQVSCTTAQAKVTSTSAHLNNVRALRTKAVQRATARKRTVIRLERSVRAQATPRKVRALRKARTDLRAARVRVQVRQAQAERARKAVLASRVAAQLCTSGGTASEAELLDILDTLGLSPLVDALGLPGLLVDLGVVDLLDMLGLADILENLGLGSLIGR